LQLSFKTALLLERYEKRGLAGGDIQLGEEALKRRPTFGKTEDAAFRQVSVTYILIIRSVPDPYRGAVN
jgi:hypothetical protein